MCNLFGVCNLCLTLKKTQETRIRRFVQLHFFILITILIYNMMFDLIKILNVNKTLLQLPSRFKCFS